MKTYAEFLVSKTQTGGDHGFAPVWMPEFLYPFQAELVEWAVRRGRAGIFADCGLGKTPMQLVWAENVVRHSNGRVLILTPLAVAAQTIAEAAKFGIDAVVSRDGRPAGPITLTNYERLHHFDTADYVAVVCDESSVLKSYDGTRRAMVTEFMRTLPYRLLCTATAAPNDYIELGTSSEALGQLGHMDMLGRFFVNQNKTADTKGRYRGFSAPRMWEGKQWRFKGHAETPFWRWVASWARALRRPSDYGHDDDGFLLPDLIQRQHLVTATRPADGTLFDIPASSLREEREEARRTLPERCDTVAGLLEDANRAVAWCHLNDESARLVRDIPGAVEVKGSDELDAKEEALIAFGKGEIRVLVTKPSIAGWGLNWQHCHRMSFFPSHSYEQHYQAVRRCWRFGQTNPVTVDMVVTEGSAKALANLSRKSKAADRMFDALVEHMRDALHIDRGTTYDTPVEVPSWL